ncbi:cell wall-binding repeat-containing protein [Halobacillus rhizosphaerae]|uniref:cell wall-binding repeat-containing protein n=1 Tax=Halobacillus rhizosphaerae TaxID=3064889 RepID=UPI00398B7E61
MKRVLSVVVVALFSVFIFCQISNHVSAASGSERIKGDNRYETAIAISKKGWPNGLTSSEKAVILARGDNPADALAAASLAGVKDAPILLTNTNSLPPEVLKEIQRLGTKKIYILGGPNAITHHVVLQLSNRGIDLKRVSGKDRFATAAAINNEAGTSNKSEAIVVNGYTVADALSASSYSAIYEIPIYLSAKDKVPSSLPGHVKKVTIYGGAGVVSEKVSNYFKGKGIAVKRIAGDNRYTTNIKAAKDLNSSNENFLLVRGTSTNQVKEDYPDAVAASGLANRLNARIVLSHPTRVINEVKNYLTTLDGKGYVLGGNNAVSQQVVSQLLNIPSETGTTGKLDITKLDIVAEKVTIKNMDQKDISMAGWKLVSVDGNQTFDFPSNFVLKKGASVTITSGRNSYESRPNVLQWSKAYLWDNNGDTARLFDPQGKKVDELKG